MKKILKAIANIVVSRNDQAQPEGDDFTAMNTSGGNKPPAANSPRPQNMEGNGFSGLGLLPEICTAVAAEGYSDPTPIQHAAIPDLLKGRDLLGCAQTGTGKTAAFALPILQRLQRDGSGKKGIRALILAPTRELAIQVCDSFEIYGKNLSLKYGVVVGGVGMEPQKVMIRKGVDILVSTPGRLLDLKSQGFVSLKDVEIFVLDEADRMLDMGFIQDVKKIIRELPRERQNLLFSATMPDEISDLAMSLLKNPRKVEVTPVSSTSELIDQCLYHVSKQDKRKLLLDLISGVPITRGLVFTRTKAIANRVTKYLCDQGVVAEAIHGNKSQSARQRALANFKDGRTKILVASDLAARGIDVDLISHVINYDLPNVPETYVHRIGRTGRAQATGRAISFCDHEERPLLRQIERLIAKNIPVISDHPYAIDPRSPAPESEGTAAQGSRSNQGQHRNRSRGPGQRPGHGGRSGSGRSTGSRGPSGRQHASRGSDSQPKRGS